MQLWWGVGVSEKNIGPPGFLSSKNIKTTNNKAYLHIFKKCPQVSNTQRKMIAET